MARLREIIKDHGRKNVRWDLYLSEFGTHPLGSVKVMASRIRNKEIKRRERETCKRIRATIRAICDAPRAPLPIARETEHDCPVIIPRAPGLEAHRVNTSTQVMQFAAEMLTRVGAQGITAGLLGDPPPGRSALDRKRAGTTEPAFIDRRKDGDWSSQVWRLRWKIERGEVRAKRPLNKQYASARQKEAHGTL